MTPTPARGHGHDIEHILRGGFFARPGWPDRAAPTDTTPTPDTGQDPADD